MFDCKIAFLLFSLMFSTYSWATVPDGKYVSLDFTKCGLTVNVQGNNYSINIGSQSESGILILYKSGDDKEIITFSNMVPDQGERKVSAEYEDGELLFQNYGNSMNYYVLFQDCDVKYIFLRRK